MVGMRHVKPEDRRIAVGVSLTPDLWRTIEDIRGDFSRSSTIVSMIRDQIAALKGVKPFGNTRDGKAIVTLAIDDELLSTIFNRTDCSLSYAIETMLQSYLNLIDEVEEAEEATVEVDLHPIYG